ncbi:MAG: succinate dehydrogenase/fumarate reductase iron-sulfur subunit [Thaumarchaeota archaeon]|nr:succinate dehydrogenase/fumarate reductase iron-sulfur subunit [Nitrososphaerota archaeon]MCY3976401.1 succinate dehydrogenase/fumarate reductase iron-sulfur subunit [Nitrososphaerota archaeon]
MAAVKSNEDNKSNFRNKTLPTVLFKIARFNPVTDLRMKFIDYKVEYENWSTVLDALLMIKHKIDPSLALRYSCRQASCGSCGMMINGKPRLACFTKINEVKSDVIRIEPMNNFPIIRDLAVDLTKMFRNHKKLKPYIIRSDSEIPDFSTSKEFLQDPDSIEQYIQFANCIKCGLCNSVCPTMATDSSFIGPQALTQAYRYVSDNRDKGKKTRLKIIDDKHGIWRCHFAGSCSKVCPKGVDPAMAIQFLRGYLLGFR